MEMIPLSLSDLLKTCRTLNKPQKIQVLEINTFGYVGMTKGSHEKLILFKDRFPPCFDLDARF